MTLTALIKMTYRFNVISIRVPTLRIWYTDKEKKESKCKECSMPQTIKDGNKFGELTLAEFKIKHRATIINMGWWWHEQRNK